jgi:transposase, IS5 family
MFRAKDPNQLKIEEFKTPFEMKMDRDNRWVKLSEIVPWEEILRQYGKNMSDFGRPGIDSRRAVGAMIIKVMLGLSDEETVEQIRENPYMQYFLGYEVYSKESVFDPSTFVYIRERLGEEAVSKLNYALLNKKEAGKKKKKDNDETQEGGGAEKKGTEGKEEAKPKGTLLLDATIADQYIKYPNDVELLQDSREKSEQMIDYIYERQDKQGKKPRTYRRKARKDYLNFAKKKNRSKREIRKAERKQLQYLGRNLRTINQKIDELEEIPFRKAMYKNYLVIQELYRQQKEMYDRRTNQCNDRIVSIHQPHVRPMVRGKQGKKVEFGSKILCGIVKGYYGMIHKLSWDAYNEGSYVIESVEQYKNQYGYYPEVVIGDRIFITRENKTKLEKMGIRLSGKSLGRKNEEKKAKEMKQMKKDQRLRVRIEGKFGQGKNKYELNRIRMRKSSTSESVITLTFFVMNLVRYAKEVFLWPVHQILRALEYLLIKLIGRDNPQPIICFCR